ncbi:MAG: hypothetical protein IPQ07_44220 [Myxococcales bacterium]|nr:hypothetical protein [Myxococcales bacterium]
MRSRGSGSSRSRASDYNALQFTNTRRFGKQLYIQARTGAWSRTAGNCPGLILVDDNIILPNNPPSTI